MGGFENMETFSLGEEQKIGVVDGREEDGDRGIGVGRWLHLLENRGFSSPTAI